MSKYVHAFALFVLLFQFYLSAQTVKFVNATIVNENQGQVNIVVSGETNSSLTRVLDEVNVFRDQQTFQLLFFARSDSGIGMPVIMPFDKTVFVDSLNEGTYYIRCFALNDNLIDSTIFFSPDSSTFFFPYNEVIPPDSLFILADTTFTVYYKKTAITEQIAAPNNFAIQAFPNPFNARLTFEFTLPAQDFVRLRVFDLSGKELSTLVSQPVSVGRHSFVWEASNYSSGLYFYKIEIGSEVHIGRVTLLK